MAEAHRRPLSPGAWILLVAALAGLVTAAINAFSSGNGIAFTGGAYLVLVSTALLLLAALVIAFARHAPRFVRGLLLVLALLDIFGTAAAAYFLESRFLIAFMALGLVGWLVHLVHDPARHAGAGAMAEAAR
ncbi:hypothetical protein [Propylenella binzhouense]|uniref:Uncharacterized protein n=1 Tax=Propylenella binzhouense TaxID=2555902 RepID=A0A964TAP5_9HYPH|nr:hypothetical protein [Propylenella binzhouense]MYZ50382.1 hypothetical protein [Propylenella binzhouense]